LNLFKSESEGAVQVSAADQAISRFATGTSGKAQTRQSIRRK